MQTGCQGPYVNGTGGFCGCNCKCCPPECCKVISVYFDCGSPYDAVDAPDGCTVSCAPFLLPMRISNEQLANSSWENLALPTPTPELPEFSNLPIISKDGKFQLGTGCVPCTIPCSNVCVELRCGGGDTPCCCLQLISGKIYSVGNGYVTAPTTVAIESSCEYATVYLNGMPPPIFINDGEEIIVTLIPIDETCCKCCQVDVKCAPCPMAMGFASRQIPLWIRKTDKLTGKTKINPKTGLPLLAINKRALIQRMKERAKKSGRRNK